MASKIITWNDEIAAKELKKRLANSMTSRAGNERDWKVSEKTVFSTGFTSWGRDNFQSDLNVAFDQVDNSTADVNISYAFKNLRFIHAQLSANPPTCIARPASSDPDDRQRADAADRLIRHAIRQYKMQEMVDRTSLNTLTYGSGFLKMTWNPHKGDIIDIDEEGSITQEGDIDVTIPNTWDIFIDPDSDTWEGARYIFERKRIPFEEALYMWPDKKDILERHRITRSNASEFSYTPGASSPVTSKMRFDVVELYEYWETGLHVNAFLGRYAMSTRDGELLEPVKPNPHRFRPSGDTKAKYEIARLPYHMFTDIDVPNSLWGKSVLDYVAPIQDTMNKLDSINLDNIQAHGVTRLVLPENAEITDDSITNTPWDVVKITGNQGPHYMQAPNTMPQVDNLRAQVRLGIDDMWGINENMFGQQSREQSSLSMQYATNQGNMIRRRLFNKYAMFTEALYKSYLDLIRKYWTTEKTILVLGKEKALEAIQIKGADIDGGFDLIVEYGASLSLDPMTRRDEIMALQPMFEKAGVPVRVSLQMMKLNELEGLYDMMELAESRQREIFEEIISTGMYIAPEELQDHENMLAFSMQFIMTTEFKYLENDIKVLIRQHVKDRAALAAQEKAAGMGASNIAQSPGPTPQGPAQMPQEAAPAGGQPQLNPPTAQ